MPELPEVQTTVSGLQKVLPKLHFTDVWSDLPSPINTSQTFKNKNYFEKTKKLILNKKVVSVSRRGKNILIHFEKNLTLLVHMKMTGHLLYGTYFFDNQEKVWKAKEKGPLQDPYNRFIHVVFTLSNKKHLAFSDARKFGKIALLEEHDLAHLGPEPLDAHFTLPRFKERLSKKPKGKVKTVLMEQSVIVGVGNIYSDEILWLAGVHPERKVADITADEMKAMFTAMKQLLRKGVDFGGDSTSDYRNIHGERGKFQYHHQAYQQTGKPCSKKSCRGVILRKVIGGRSAHFCSIHQK